MNFETIVENLPLYIEGSWTTLQLLAIELAERPVAGKVQLLGLEVEDLFGRGSMRLGRGGIGADPEGPGEHHREEGADEQGNDADHGLSLFRLA